jgi:hypothetical protein
MTALLVEIELGAHHAPAGELTSSDLNLVKRL